jgi:hypothetical protein
LTYEDLGEQAVKNISKPVRVYRVVFEDSASQKSKVKTQKSKIEDRRVGIAHQKWAMVVVTGLLIIAGALITIRYFSFPLITHHSSLRRRSLRQRCPCPTNPPSSFCRSTT